ncbi:MAG: phosphotransferase [Acidimicrobiia bacterium]
MHWPSDHPAVIDPELAHWAPGVDELCADGVVQQVLRHLPGRRVATLVATSNGPKVVKVFASPRARGNARRLAMLSDGPAAHLLPLNDGADAAGHVSMTQYVPGVVFDQLDDNAFVARAEQVGAGLALLHSGSMVLDRCWTVEREIEQLMRRATAATADRADAIAEACAHLAEEPLVTAHRDCHPRQVVFDDERMWWIDLDDLCMAPAALDVGNMIAHLRRDGALGRRDIHITERAVDAFISGYGPVTGDVEAWECLALVRLAALAESRHSSMSDRDRVLEILAQRELTWRSMRGRPKTGAAR